MLPSLLLYTLHQTNCPHVHVHDRSYHQKQQIQGMAVLKLERGMHCWKGYFFSAIAVLDALSLWDADHCGLCIYLLYVPLPIPLLGNMI